MTKVAGELLSDWQIDKWELYRIARWCDELVPDGRGGTEPRFRSDLVISSQEDAHKVLSDMVSIFQGTMYYNGEQIVPIADMPTSFRYVYSPANVVDGEFTYSGSDRFARHTVGLISWNDPKDFGRAKVRYVEDGDGIQRYGVNKSEIIALGTSYESQAERKGRHLLATERYATDLVVFGVGEDGIVEEPGRVVAIVINS